ncbi:hypothetical protein SCALM49S_02167 [Streptomyces californicus]
MSSGPYVVNASLRTPRAAERVELPVRVGRVDGLIPPVTRTFCFLSRSRSVTVNRSPGFLSRASAATAGSATSTGSVAGGRGGGPAAGDPQPGAVEGGELGQVRLSAPGRRVLERAGEGAHPELSSFPTVTGSPSKASREAARTVSRPRRASRAPRWR